MTPRADSPQTSDVKPCPFCGAPAKVARYGAEAQIICSNVDAELGACPMLPCTRCETFEVALRRWNTRTADPVSPAEGRIAKEEGEHVALTSDEAKALRRLIPEFDAYPTATGLSHLVALLVRDAATFRAYRDGAKSATPEEQKP